MGRDTQELVQSPHSPLPPASWQESSEDWFFQLRPVKNSEQGRSRRSNTGQIFIKFKKFGRRAHQDSSLHILDAAVPLLRVK